jgi:hypothetical protein
LSVTVTLPVPGYESVTVAFVTTPEVPSTAGSNIQALLLHDDTGWALEGLARAEAAASDATTMMTSRRARPLRPLILGLPQLLPPARLLS